MAKTPQNALAVSTPDITGNVLAEQYDLLLYLQYPLWLPDIMKQKRKHDQSWKDCQDSQIGAVIFWL